MNENEIYCRVENGVIIEYPVYAVHIRNRSHPFDMYTKVAFANKPELPPFAVYTSKIEMTAGIPLVTYGIEYKSLQTILNEIHNNTGAPLLPGETAPAAVEFQDIPAATVARVVELAKKLADEHMTAWAKTREYDDIVSVATYATSKNTARAAEGQKAVDNRDAVWDAYYNYLGKVIAKVVPVPRTIAEISAQLPTLEW